MNETEHRRKCSITFPSYPSAYPQSMIDHHNGPPPQNQKKVTEREFINKAGITCASVTRKRERRPGDTVNVSRRRPPLRAWCQFRNGRTPCLETRARARLLARENKQITPGSICFWVFTSGSKHVSETKISGIGANEAHQTLRGSTGRHTCRQWRSEAKTRWQEGGITHIDVRLQNLGVGIEDVFHENTKYQVLTDLLVP